MEYWTEDWTEYVARIIELMKDFLFPWLCGWRRVYLLMLY